MKYACLMYHAEAGLNALSAEEGKALTADCIDYDRKLEKSGHLILARALRPVQTARTVRRRKGKIVVIDGPFAETKETLIGFVLVDAASLEEAIEIAGNSPMANSGIVEVREFYNIQDE